MRVITIFRGRRLHMIIESMNIKFIFKRDESQKHSQCTSAFKKSRKMEPRDSRETQRVWHPKAK